MVELKRRVQMEILIDTTIVSVTITIVDSQLTIKTMMPGVPIVHHVLRVLGGTVPVTLPI